MKQTLCDAIFSCDLNRISTALLAGENPNERCQHDPRWFPLQMAIDQLDYGGQIDAISLLIASGADIECSGESTDSPLLMALFRGKDEAAGILIDAGANTNIRGSEGDSPLGWCIEHGNLVLAQKLLQHGASATINEPAGGFLGLTALGMAVKRLDLEAIDLLLKAGADPQVQDADGRTAIQVLRLAPKSDLELIANVTSKFESYKITREYG